MKYVILLYAAKDAWPPDENKQAIAESIALCHCLHNEGKYISAAPLHPPEFAKCIQVRDGSTHVYDGPFAETKEQLGATSSSRHVVLMTQSGSHQEYQVREEALPRSGRAFTRKADECSLGSHSQCEIAFLGLHFHRETRLKNGESQQGRSIPSAESFDIELATER